MNIAVFLPNWIGDVVMATPTLRALREHFGTQAHLIGVMRPYVAEVLAGTPWLDDHLFYLPRVRRRGLGMWPLVKNLRGRSIDLALLLPNSFRSALLAWLGGATRRVGYDRQLRGLLLTQRVPQPRKRGRLRPTSAIDLYLELARQIGCARVSRRTQLATVVEDERHADRVFQQLELANSDRNLVVFNPAGGGNSGVAVRGWPDSYFAELGRRVATDCGADVLVICGPREQQAARRIAKLAGHRRVRSLAGHEVKIGALKACIRRADLLVTTDTGPRHLAAAFDVPHVALCGPIDPAWSHTHHPRQIQLTVDVPCRPCGKLSCRPGHRRCMKDLTVDTVLAAVQHQLDENVRQRNLRGEELGNRTAATEVSRDPSESTTR